ncbi:MAG TPA: nucleotide sugar dehydrogenase [Ktedonobacteraceae bacterium]|nr:nucleotide sugar dehydrogenase [Ktedonobacteraceae bacterium]
MTHSEATGLQQRIEQRAAVVGVIGLGYVGLPLAVEFARAAFRVVGFDIDKTRVDALNKGICHISDVDARVFQQALETRLEITNNFDRLTEADAVIICVPTPLNKNKEPDVSHIMSAAEHIARRLRRGQLIILESTTFPGTTTELLLPLFERRGLHVGSDFWLAFSPERIDPGNRRYALRDTPRVVGGITTQCTRLATALYHTIVEQVVPVSSPATAELVKLLENTYRAVNIGLANEFAQMADILGIDIWEVIEAAATKPYGFTPFYPGPGPGGHCIPIDPLYLSWKLRSLRYRARFIELASEINQEMPEFVVDLAARALNEHGKCLNGSRILALGVAYKRDISDLRESPALDVMRLLLQRRAHLAYIDQHVPCLQLNDNIYYSKTLTGEALREVDCVLILTDHSGVDYAQVVREARLVVDTRNATANLPEAAHVWRLSRPRAGQQSGQAERGAA